MPLLLIVIRLIADALSCVPNTNAVPLSEAENVSSASAHIDAAGNTASVPLASNGALKSIRPNISPSFIFVSAVVNANLPVLVVASADGPRTSRVSSDSSYNIHAPEEAPKNLTS